MSTDIGYIDDVTGYKSTVQGSDRRLNVSSRSDTRAYYISRDQGDAYALVFNHAAAGATEQLVYLKNTNATKQMVIESIGINSELLSRVRLQYVTGTAAVGSAVVPTNLNRKKSRIAEATASVGVHTGITADGQIDFVGITAGSHEEMRLDDRVRLGNGDAIALEYVEGSAGDLWGVIFFYYETVK